MNIVKTAVFWTVVLGYTYQYTDYLISVIGWILLAYILSIAFQTGDHKS